MISKFLSFALFAVAVYSIGSQPVFAMARDDGATEKVKSSVRKLASSDDPRVVVKMKNGNKIEGRVSQVLDDSFDVTDPKTKVPNTILYTDVASVKKHGWSKGSKIALGAGIGAAVTVAIVAGVIAKKGLSGFCPLGCSSMLRP